MKGKAIIVKNLNDDQLNILIDYLITNHYKWCHSDLDKESITRSDVLYMKNNNSLLHSSLVTFKQYFKDYYELVAFNELIQMKKSNLKPGMVVEYADGKKRLVTTVNGKLFLMGVDMFSELDNFDENLISKTRGLNIMRVFQPKEPRSLTSLLGCDNCIWERQETVLTMQEIADKFGIPVEQLRIKK